MVETLPYTYTSQSEMESIASSLGVRSYFDDDNDGTLDSSTLADVIAEATDEINFYCQARYAYDQLNQSLWIRRAASIIALHLASMRRNNPGVFQDHHDRVIKQLEQIESFRRAVPRLQEIDNLEPGFSNLVVDDRYARNKIRVQTDTSEGGTDGRQNPDTIFPFNS